MVVFPAQHDDVPAPIGWAAAAGPDAALAAIGWAAGLDAALASWWRRRLAAAHSLALQGVCQARESRAEAIAAYDAQRCAAGNAPVELGQRRGGHR